MNRIIRIFIKFLDFISKKDFKVEWNIYVLWWDSILNGSLYISKFAKLFIDYISCWIFLAYSFSFFYILVSIIIDILNGDTHELVKKVDNIIEISTEDLEYNKKIETDKISSDTLLKVPSQQVDKLNSNFNMRAIGLAVFSGIIGVVVIVIKMYWKKD